MGEWDFVALHDAATIEKGRLQPLGRGPATIVSIGAAELDGGDSGRRVLPFGGVDCEPNDVVMLWDGERSGLVATGLRGAAGSTTARIRPKPNTNGRFLFQLLRSQFSYIQAQRTGTGVPHVPKDLGSRLTLSLPSLTEQRRIAEILDTLDETIAAKELVIAKLDRLDKGIVRKMIEESASTAGAQRCRISDFARIKRGASPRPIDNPAWFSDVGPGWVRIGDVTAAGERLLETRDRLSAAGARRSVRVSPGNVIMSIAATIGLAIVVDMEARIHDGFVFIDQDGSVDPDYLVMLLHHHRADFIRQGQTGTQSNINSEIVGRTEVVVPSRARQLKVCEIVGSARALLRVERSRLSKLRHLRAGLCDDLLTGRVRTVRV